MSLEPKNWTEFQHYKNRSPIWIKLHRNLLDDFDFHRLPVASRALAPMLWLLASEYDDGKITATTEEIAFRLRMTEVDLFDALKPLIENKFFITASELLAPRKQVAIPEKRREQLRDREEKNIGRSQPTRPERDEKFEEFKQAYPKRKGANPWKPAQALFDRAILAGSSADQIIAAVRSGVGFDREKVGTEYIPQAVKWLRDERWKDLLAQPPPDKPQFPPPPGMQSLEEFRAEFYGVSHDQAGTEIRGNAGLGKERPN
jgi:hypothetical protein